MNSKSQTCWFHSFKGNMLGIRFCMYGGDLDRHESYQKRGLNETDIVAYSSRVDKVNWISNSCCWGPLHSADLHLSFDSQVFLTTQTFNSSSLTIQKFVRTFFCLKLCWTLRMLNYSQHTCALSPLTFV